MRKYKFEICWNTGDPYWDSTPETEWFEGSIDELNAYLNNKMNPDVRSFEPGDVTGADVKELLETGESTRMSGNEIWMIQSVKEL